MEISRKWRFWCFLLGLFFLATTLQGVQGEVELESGPSESQCRPYIEKALKELDKVETEPTDPGASSEQEGDVPSTEATADDSEHVTSAGEDDTDKGESTESTEAQQEEQSTEASVEDQAKETSAEAKDSVEQDESQGTQEDDKKSEEGDEGSKAEESVEQADEAAAASTESQEQGTEEVQAESTEQEGEKKESAETAESTEAASDGEADTKEEADDSQAQSAEAEDVKSTEGDETPSQEAAAEAEAEGEKSAEDEQSHEQAQSGEATEEEGAKSQETAESQEVTGEEASKQEGSVEEQAEESKEGGEESQEADAPSQEGAEASQEDAETSKEGEGASKEDAASAEGQAESAEDDTKSQETATEEDKTGEDVSADKAAASEDSQAAQSAEEAASAEEGAASAEESAASVEEAAASVEEGAASVEEGAASVEEGAASVEESGASKEGAASAEEGAASVEEGAASVEEASMEKETAESQEAEADKESKESAAPSAEEQAESKETAEEKSAEGGDSEAAVASEEASQADTAESTEGESKEVVPEEDLILEMEIPENLRPRDQIDQLLKLDDTYKESEAVVNRIAEVTLRELKRLYENAIKPLETLYKYRDLSNRHFGDSEIFSKPLVLFMGPWSGGKSSIINYLLNNEYNVTSLRTGAEPSPAYFNLLMHGSEPEVLDGTQLAADFTFAGLQKFGQGLEERLRGQKLPSKLLEKVNIVEIPGILEVRKQVSRVFPFNDACQWFIDRADIIFLVYDPSKLDVGPETEAILDQLKGREHQTRIILNKADQVKPEELMRVQGALIWNISPLMSSAQPPVMYTTSLWSRPYEAWAPVRLLQAQERAFLRDLRSAVDKRIDNKISSARRFAVRVRNHAKMVDCYLTTYYNHKSVFGNRKQVADQIIEHPQDYHIYEGLSTLTNISRYDLPDPDVYRDFFRLNPLYEFQQLSSTCTYFRGCPINRLDVAIAYDLPELVGKHKKMVETALAGIKTES